MKTPPPENAFSDYQIVLNAYLELRGQGVSVSQQDLEVLKSWATDGLSPTLIVQALEAIALEKQENGKRLSHSLKSLDRGIRRAIRDSQIY